MSSPVGVWEYVWVCHDNGDRFHFLPPGDLVEHERTTRCVCGPYLEDIGGGDFLVAHAALDGRA